MSDYYFYSDTSCRFLLLRGKSVPGKISFYHADGASVSLPEIRRQKDDNQVTVTFDAAGLSPWTPEHPVRYIAEIDGEKINFGYIDFRQDDHRVLVNGAPYYFRGYIRGITAHEHPNLTGGTKYDFYRKNILQAKKYGFNLVRFHSTVPEEDFVAAADELGLFIHMEIGYSYQYDHDGNKTGINLDPEHWLGIIRKYRNHPSLAIFCLGNEMHNSGRVPEVHRLYAAGRDLAPGKLIMDNSGWGEYDRTSADIYSQHIAYFFPYKTHARMFEQDFCWKKNGSMYEIPLQTGYDDQMARLEVTRTLNPVRPVIAHETLHYIDFPDYPAMERKFDAFCRQVGEKYLAENQIVKPRYLTAIPALAAAKGLQDKLPDYIAASREFKRFAVKTYLERLRLAEKLCGYEMLQFADCLKYENGNGVVDCFDDDKYLDAAWFRHFNSDTVLLADLPEETTVTGTALPVTIHLSHYGPEALLTGTLKLFLHNGRRRREIFAGDKFSAMHGVHQLVEVKIRFKPSDRPVKYELEAELITPNAVLANSWTVWNYPSPQLKTRPQLKIGDTGLCRFLEKIGRDIPQDENTIITDTLDNKIWAPLAAGKTVILCYHRDRPGNAYYWPGTLDRFKPCIWDRGNHLGGIIYPDWLQEALATGRYFRENLYPLIEAGYKINLDHFPVKVNEAVSGVDKPCRDRMNGLLKGVKDFQSDEVIRNFSYLFSVKVGPGTLIVSTFNLKKCHNPVVGAYLAALINHAPQLDTAARITAAELKNYLRTATENGVIRETVMNRFWELDNKPVEDTLFWEEAGVDLTKLEEK